MDDAATIADVDGGEVGGDGVGGDGDEAGDTGGDASGLQEVVYAIFIFCPYSVG